MPCRWCGGLTFLWHSVVSCLTTTICSIIYVQCTRFSLWWCMEHWVYITSTMKLDQWWPQSLWHAFLSWFWFGKSQDSLKYFGAHLHSFWVSNTCDFYFCISACFVVVTFLTTSHTWDCQLVSLYWFTVSSQFFFHPWPHNLLYALK